MLALAGYPLGLHFRFLDPSPEAPVGRIATRITANFDDRAALTKFASGLELVTWPDEEKQSYALGMNVGSQLRNWSLELDRNLFMQGLKDVLSGGVPLDGRGRA